MEFADACRQLNAWIAHSQGELISLPGGQKRAFRQVHHYDRNQIAAFEKTWNFLLPADYREFLLTVGAASCFIELREPRFSGEISPHTTWLSFRRLDEIPRLMEETFVARERPNMFPSLLLVVSLIDALEGGFYFERPAPDQFSVFMPDTYPDVEGGDWLEGPWCTFSEWLSIVVESAGTDMLPRRRQGRKKSPR